jgi:ribosomal protein S18 acetylase RimI-like enzyme
VFDFGMHITTRIATPADAEALAELAARTFSDTYAPHNSADDMARHLEEHFGPAQQRRELADAGMATVVTEVDGRMVGYAQLRSGATPSCVSGDRPIEIQRFYVTREWHGRGVAQVLMQAAKVEAARRGGRTLWLGVWEKNERGRAFYRREGFRDVGSQTFVLGADRQTDRVVVIPIRETTADDATEVPGARGVVHGAGLRGTVAEGE